MSEPVSLTAAFDRIEQLLEFPADFPIKVMGRQVEGFAQSICDLAREHVPDFDPASIELRLSSKGSFLSITLPLRLQSRTQLEAVYRALAAHPMVRVVL